MFLYPQSCKGVPAPPFLRHPPLEPACPLFLKFLFPPIFIIDTFPYPHADNPFFALVRNTNLPYTHRFIFIQLRMTFIPKIMMAGKSFSTKILRNALEVHLLYFRIIHMHTQYFCLTYSGERYLSLNVIRISVYQYKENENSAYAFMASICETYFELFTPYALF